LLKTSVNISIKFWMRSCGLYPIKAPESDSRLRGNDITARAVPRERLPTGREHLLDLSDPLCPGCSSARAGVAVLRRGSSWLP
jgi:hypothetical protein